MQPDQDIPDPHQDWRGPRQQKPRNLLRQVYKWAFTNLLIEPLATISIYAVRLMDKTTGIPYSADELEAKILSQAGAGTTDSLTTSNGTAAAAAGKLGEHVETVVVAPVPLTNDTTANIASRVLSAGDWDVCGFVQFGATGATTSYRSAALSSISASIGGDAMENGIPTNTLDFSETIVTPPTRFLLAAPATIYLVATVGLSAGTIGATGTITARRVR
jgi:hypothetical protein